MVMVHDMWRYRLYVIKKQLFAVFNFYRLSGEPVFDLTQYDETEGSVATPNQAGVRLLGFFFAVFTVVALRTRILSFSGLFKLFSKEMRAFFFSIRLASLFASCFLASRLSSFDMPFNRSPSLGSPFGFGRFGCLAFPGAVISPEEVASCLLDIFGEDGFLSALHLVTLSFLFANLSLTGSMATTSSTQVRS